MTDVRREALDKLRKIRLKHEEELQDEEFDLDLIESLEEVDLGNEGSEHDE